MLVLEVQKKGEHWVKSHKVKSADFVSSKHMSELERLTLYFDDGTSLEIRMNEIHSFRISGGAP